jgi:signal transduction histidine kinase
MLTVAAGKTVAQQTFPQLVSLACHDLRTPLATASGFATTLERLDEIGQPAARYVEMIGAATDQMAALLDLLGAAARVEDERFEPLPQPTNARALADAAARQLPDGAASVAGEGSPVEFDPRWGAVALGAIAEAARRHGGVEQIALAVDGPTVEISPIVDGAGAVATGEDLRDFPAAVGASVLKAAGASVELDGDRLRVRFPERTSTARASTGAGP